MGPRALWLAAPILGLAAGCGGVDVQMRNPLLARAVDANRIVRTHEYIERARGLPPGSVADEASLVSVDEQRVCFSVSLHELDPIDLRSVEAHLRVPKLDSIDTPQVWAEAPVYVTYNGLIPERRQVGTETFCHYRDPNGNCLSWQTRPLYATVNIPGPVQVYQTRGTLCFPNRNAVGPATERVTLELRLQRQPSMTGQWVGTKELELHWGFLTGAK